MKGKGREHRAKSIVSTTQCPMPFAAPLLHCPSPSLPLSFTAPLLHCPSPSLPLSFTAFRRSPVCSAILGTFAHQHINTSTYHHNIQFSFQTELPSSRISLPQTGTSCLIRSTIHSQALMASARCGAEVKTKRLISPAGTRPRL